MCICCCRVHSSLDVTEEGHSPQNPVVGVGCMAGSSGCAQRHSCDVGQVCAARFLVNRAHVHLGVFGVFCGVDSIQVNDGQLCEQHLGGGLSEFAAPAVPASPIQVQPMHVDPLCGRVLHLFLHHLCDIIVQDDRVEGPALVGSGHLLAHGREEALRVKEPRHPKHVGPGSEDPVRELIVAFQQLCEPEAQGGGLP